MTPVRYNHLLLLVAGLGGLLYGVDVGIIAGALPYLEATSGLGAGRLSFVVAAVLLGSVISTLFAGMLADLFGRKPMMIASGLLFAASIPVIAGSHGYGALILGRLLQGASGGFIGVVVPLYLAECLGPSARGRGTGVFQWLLTLGIVAAALLGMYFSMRVRDVAALGDAQRLLAFKDTAWRSIFWGSLPPGLLFVLGGLAVAESPRWLHRRGRREAARAALLRSRTPEQAEMELREMDVVEGPGGAGPAARDSLAQRKYVLPFVLACVILACNQTTGVNSILGYNTAILLQGGLSDTEAHWGYVILATVNFVLTIGGVALVDRKGRKFLLSLGTAGIVVSLVLVGLLFRRTEGQSVDARAAVQAMTAAGPRIAFDPAIADRLLAASGGGALAGRPVSMVVIYSYGDFRAATTVLRSADPAPVPFACTRESCVPSNRVLAFFSRPLADLGKARTANLRIESALITPVASEANGWLTAVLLFCFMGFFAVGPGVCVWLALSELMPTRIRSNGMSLALLINQTVSTVIAAGFLPGVGRFGYSTVFFSFAGFTALYFVTATFFLPETKGRTLEEIEMLFQKDGGRGGP
jgi:MFS family permease